jgi:hypothetical protein
VLLLADHSDHVLGLMPYACRLHPPYAPVLAPGSPAPQQRRARQENTTTLAKNPSTAFAECYLLWISVTNSVWETFRLPLYGLRHSVSATGLAVAVLHCTAGDLLIAAAAPLIALLFAGAAVRDSRERRILVLCIPLGIAYTISANGSMWNFAATGTTRR